MIPTLALLIATFAGDGDTDRARFENLPHTETLFEADEIATLGEWNARRTWLRSQVRWAAGLWPELERTPLGARVFDPFEGDGFTVWKVVFESAPGLLVTGNLYRPSEGGGRRPAILCPHGHWAKGRVNHEPAGSIPARCITLARHGAVVFAYDMMGYNDSGRQLGHHEAALESAAAELWCLGPFALQTWNSIRALDFVSSLPDVDPGRLGVTGASGGGTQTFILSAVDERVTAACPVNMISHSMQGGCSCENAAGLRIDANNMDIAALFAPKPLLMISATGDWTRDTPKVEHAFVRSIYALYGQADRVLNVHVDAPHNYNAESRSAMYPFFAKWLLQRPDHRAVKERAIEVPPTDRLLVFESKPDVPTAAELAQSLRQQVRQRLEDYAPVDDASLGRLRRLVRTGLQHATGSPFPAQGEVTVSGEPGHRTYHRGGRTVTTRVLQENGAAGEVWVLTPSGVSPSVAEKQALEPLKSQASIIAVEPFGTGANTAPAEARRGSTRYFTTFNRTDHAETVYDLITLLAHSMSEHRGEPLSILASPELSPKVLAAIVSLPEDIAAARPLRLALDFTGFDPNADESWVQHLRLPGVLRIGGLAALVHALPTGCEVTISGLSRGAIPEGDSRRISASSRTLAEQARDLAGMSSTGN
ncbi:MAG: acetylxylan esterase [Planctomycetota bacterium]